MELEQSDASLVMRAQIGDRAAFAGLVERYQQPLGSYLWRLSRDRDLALDLTQETFLRAYRAIGSTRPGLEVRPWLYRIATNLAYDEFRRHRRHRQSELGKIEPSTTQDQSLAVEERELVQHALAALRPNDRAVLLLCAVEELSYREVAAVLDCSSEAVRKQFTRAKERFRTAYTALVPKSLSQAS
jgi:RNA polymerase sigma-70 factor, ECF subfamily